MTTCTVKTTFSAAKRLTEYDGPCSNLHGYQHTLEASFTSNSESDILIDFYELKEVLGNWIHEHLDHTVILNESDRKLGDFISSYTGQTIYYLPSDPTAERLAEHLKNTVCPQLFPNADCIKLRLYDAHDAWVEI